MFRKSFLPELPKLEQVTTAYGRYYVHPETNFRYESVTTVIKNAYDQTWIDDWRENVGAEVADRISADARHRGNVLHKLMEDHVLGHPTDDKWVPFNLRKGVRTLRTELDRGLGEVYGVETRIFSDKLHAAGTFDLFGTWYGTPTVIDFKGSTGRKKEKDIPHYFVQACAYATMIEEKFGIDVPKLMIVIVQDFENPVFFETPTDLYRNEVQRIFVDERKVCWNLSSKDETNADSKKNIFRQPSSL